jgi:hypothetical protein
MLFVIIYSESIYMEIYMKGFKNHFYGSRVCWRSLEFVRCFALFASFAVNIICRFYFALAAPSPKTSTPRSTSTAACN